jgi:hypothetical protein
LKRKRETVKYWAARRFTLRNNWYHFKDTKTLHVDEQKTNIENRTSIIRKNAEKPDVNIKLEGNEEEIFYWKKTYLS